MVSKYSVLIVEDDPVSARITEKVVEQLGYEVRGVFKSGEEAVLRLPSLEPDLVLMDIVLAGEMDGVQAARLIRSLHAVPVIFLTATTDDVIGRVGESGGCGYIHKPVKLLDLKANLEMALARAETERRLRYAQERRAVLDALPVAVLLAGRDMAVRWANPMAERLLSIGVEAMSGRSVPTVLAGLFDFPMEQLAAAASGGGERQACIRGSDHRKWRVILTSTRDEEAIAGGLVITFYPLEDA